MNAKGGLEPPFFRLDSAAPCDFHTMKVAGAVALATGLQSLTCARPTRAKAARRLHFHTMKAAGKSYLGPFEKTLGPSYGADRLPRRGPLGLVQLRAQGALLLSCCGSYET